jgi:septal ring factor EnvC (AmiA/AmiB activator)
MAHSHRFAPIRPRFCRGTALLLASGVAVALLAFAFTGARAEDDLTRDEAKAKLKATEQQLKANREQAEGLAGDVAALDAERARLNEELIEAARRAQESEAELSAIEVKLADLTDQVNVIKNSITERKETIVKMLSAMQRMGRTPPPALVTTRDDALAVVRSAMLLAEVFPELEYQADNLSHELEGLVTLENGIREQRDAHKRKMDNLASEQARIDALLAEKKARLAQSEAQLAQVRNIAEQQAAQVTELNDLIGRLDQQIAKAEVAQYDAEVAAEKALRAREQEQALATPSNESLVEIKPDQTKVAFASPDRMKPAVPFDAAKGTLPLPAQGKLVKHFGDADNAGGTWKGISLQTRGQARITAPADGWVVYAGTFRSYGQLLILNAGGGYHVLLAGMSRIDVSLGQFVLAGEAVGVMGGPAPANGSDILRPVLYVEFRKDGRPIDPDPWWAAASEKVQG